MSHVTLPDTTWTWEDFVGDPAALKWNRREIPKLDRVIALTRRRKAAVQAGGNLGIFPKRLAETFETVYTFEPAGDLFTWLQQNAPEPNIIKFQAALGDERGLIGMSRERRDGKPDNHAGITYVAGPGNIPTLRIDDLGLAICDLIYLDLEGWELYALRGATNTIDLCRPLVAVEINKSLDFVGIDPAIVRQEVLRHSYRFVARWQSDEIFVPDEWSRV